MHNITCGTRQQDYDRSFRLCWALANRTVTTPAPLPEISACVVLDLWQRPTDTQPESYRLHPQCQVCRSIFLRRAPRLLAALHPVPFARRSYHSRRRCEGTAAEGEFRERLGSLLLSHPSRHSERLRVSEPERASTLEDLGRELPGSHPTHDAATA